MKQPLSFSPKTVVIYSVGLLGGSIGLALKTSGFGGKIIGLSSQKNLNTALSLDFIDEGYTYDKTGDVITSADVLILCSPILAIIDTIKTISSLNLPENLIITDVGSTKKEITSTAKKYLPTHVHFIGGHPMAGSEKSGPAAADPYLFQNAIYVLTPPEGKPDGLHNNFAKFLEKYLGCRYIFLDPASHDIIAATVSHVPHLLAVALVNVAQEIENGLPQTLNLAAGGFRDLTRIASAPYKMWHDILATNKNCVESILTKCIQILSDMKNTISTDELEKNFISAANTRDNIPIRNKGFISPLHEVLVLAKDQPGIIASISNALADNNINIKDIEVLKVREGEGGTIRLAFDSSEVSKSVITILHKMGFSARERK